jgi:BON domain-containing protein
MSNRWLCSLAGFLILSIPQALQAQTTGTSGTTGSSSLGSSGVSGGSSGVTSNAVSNQPISGPSFGNLGPSTTLGPTLAIPGTNTPSMGIGGRGTTGPGGTTTATPVPTSYNPWQAYYLNAQQPGLGSSLTGSQNTGGRSTTNTGGAFGQPLYANLQATATTTTTSTTPTAQTQATGFTTMGLNKAPAFVTALSDDFVVSRPGAGQLQKQLLGILSRSSALKGQGKIELTVNGNQVTLKGEVSRGQLRYLAEGLVRMTPGVDNVVNELQVTAAKK